MLDLLTCCRTEGVRLDGHLTHKGGSASGAVLLWAIAGLESSHGRDRESARYEPTYAKGGPYSTAPEQRLRLEKYGALAACSFGSFQLMFPVACEMGFTGKPWELIDDAACAHCATDLILHRFIEKQGAKTVANILDAYNSGTWRDTFVPAGYVRNGILLFEQGLPSSSDSPSWTQPPP